MSVEFMRKLIPDSSDFQAQTSALHTAVYAWVIPTIFLVRSHPMTRPFQFFRGFDVDADSDV